MNRGFADQQKPAGFADKRFAAPVSNRGGWYPIVHEPFAGAWQQNKELNRESQLAYYAVFACMTLIASDLGKMRPKLMEQDSDGVWSEVKEYSPYAAVLRKPNRYQNHIQFKEWWALSKLSHGNAYALKERDARGVVVAEYLLNPANVKPLVAPDGAVYYELKADDLNGLKEDSVIVPASEIIHDRMNCLYHPLVGISPLYACGIAAGNGLSIQQQSSQFFANGARPSGVLTVPGDIEPEEATAAMDLWHQRYGPGNTGRTALLSGGMTYQPISQSAHDAQLVEQLKLTADIVCSVFHVPPAKIGLQQDTNAANAEIRNLNYYSDCLQKHIEDWELCQDEGLGIGYGVTTNGRTLGVELETDDLLRLDSKAQMETLGMGVEKAIVRTNEARAKLGYAKVQGGDTIWQQQQYYSLEALAERDRNEPFAKQEPPVIEQPKAEDDAEENKRFAAAFDKCMGVA